MDSGRRVVAANSVGLRKDVDVREAVIVIELVTAGVERYKSRERYEAVLIRREKCDLERRLRYLLGGK